jgi:DNA polymerase-3 subunit alpha
MFAAVKFFLAARRMGIKPLLGAEIRMAASDRADDVPYSAVLLCKDREGYLNLSRLMTRGYLDAGRRLEAVTRPEWLSHESCAGLIALAGGIHGDIGHALTDGNSDLAARRLDWWRERFEDRFYLDVTRTGRPRETVYVDAAVDLADRTATPVVATNEVRFLKRADFEAHEARVCIQHGRTLNDARRPRPYSAEQYLKSAMEMRELFADLPDAIENSLSIAQRCNFEFSLSTYHLPEFPDVANHELDAWLRESANTGLARRLSGRAAGAAAQYRARLDTELNVITGMGFAGYFLIVADFIRWAKSRGIPVGPGRGSGAGSLVAYALGITELDPIEHDLLFERFLNPERVSMPDFDVDFCMDRRDEVIEYVADKFGHDRVAQIITHGTMAARAVVRDVGRALGFPYGFVDQIAKLIPFELNMTLDRALAESPELKQRVSEDEDVQAIIDLARQLEGVTRSAGRHAAGVVIAPEPLTHYMPLFREPGGEMPVTQFDMGDVESMGLLKFDFLGLRTLTIIDWAIKDINAKLEAGGGAPIDINRIPVDDERTFRLIRQAATTAVFQLEGRGMKELVKRLKPDLFGDLIALVALYRPGPLQSGMVDDFIERKHGRAAVRYPHPSLEPVLKPTYGVIVYQEQVMQIARVLAGYTLGAADLLRRAMGKKKPEEMAKQRETFVAGAARNGVGAELASGIFDLMEKFSGYGFCKAHAAAYALVAYQTAWLKAHHPAAFMAAVLSADMDATDKIIGLIDECRRLGLAIEAPDVNRSEYRFSVSSATSIRYGLGAIKGLGSAAVEAVTAERDGNGPYPGLYEFCMRADLRKLNRRALEVLVKSGAFDSFGKSRRALSSCLDDALKAAEQNSRQLATGQTDMFGLAAVPDGEAAGRAAVVPDLPEWAPAERLKYEKETLGFYLSGHPIDPRRTELDHFVSCSLRDLKPGRRIIAGLVADLRFNRTRRGRLATLTIEDASGRVEAIVYSEVLESNLDKLIVDNLVIVEGTCAEDAYSGEVSLTAERIHTIEEARQRFARGLLVKAGDGTRDLVTKLKSALAPYRPGECPVIIDYRVNGAEARVVLGADWRVRATDELISTLRGHFGDDRIGVEY